VTTLPTTLRSGGAVWAVRVAPQKKDNTSTTVGRSKVTSNVIAYSDDDRAFAAFILAGIILRETGEIGAFTLRTPRRQNGYNRSHFASPQVGEGRTNRHELEKTVLGVLTALVTMAATYVLPRGGVLRDTSLARFPMTV
jgi:hypothetical protein